MARIIDKDTRLIDVEFGPVRVLTTRPAGNLSPTSSTGSLNGMNDVIVQPLNSNIIGSFVQYIRVDLEYMTLNNEVMQPVDVSVQRTSPVPIGFNNNGNTFDQIEEFVYIFSRPLLNQDIENLTTTFQDLRSLGLDRTQTSNPNAGGVDSGIPSKEQTIYAEKRMYSYNSSLGASIANGALDPANVDFVSLQGMPMLDSVTTWGSLSSITGPALHCYRVVINRTQNLVPVPNLFIAETFNGQSDLTFPPCNVSFLCKDPSFTEGQYLTRLANAMNDIPEGGQTA